MIPYLLVKPILHENRKFNFLKEHKSNAILLPGMYIQHLPNPILQSLMPEGIHDRIRKVVYDYSQDITIIQMRLLILREGMIDIVNLFNLFPGWKSHEVQNFGP